MAPLVDVERMLMNSPFRAAHHHLAEASWFRRLHGGDLAGLRVLDLGCGRGVGIEVLLDRLGASEVVGIDLDPALVDKARRRLARRPQGQVAVRVADALDIPLPADSFDVVTVFGALHHVPAWQAAVGEVARVLRPGGRLLFEEVPRGVLDTWVMRTFTDHPVENRFEPEELVEELLRHDLRVRQQPQRRVAGLVFVGAARLERSSGGS